MKLPPTILIQEKNFHNAWARSVRYVLRDGVPLVIGDATKPKPIRDVCATIELTGDAIRQIDDRELHTQFPFKHITQYCEEFTRDYLTEYYEKSEEQKFSYLYFDRLTRGNRDQITWLNFNLRNSMDSEISSNRHQAITWDRENDISNPASPCLQHIWIRYLGNLSVEVHLTWRSRDLYTAWQVNIVAIIDMLNREIIRPNNCRIVKLVDYVDSLHIYESDIAAAKHVRLVPVSPQH